jgi:hypothetical protein
MIQMDKNSSFHKDYFEKKSYLTEDVEPNRYGEVHNSSDDEPVHLEEEDSKNDKSVVPNKDQSKKEKLYNSKLNKISNLPARESRQSIGDGDKSDEDMESYQEASEDSEDRKERKRNKKKENLKNLPPQKQLDVP